jgi:hypothetical protein
VKITLGPKGRNAVIEKKFGAPIITKDGVTVAKEIELQDPLENLGAQMVREVASKTSDVAGDGTTTAGLVSLVDLPRRRANGSGWRKPVHGELLNWAKIGCFSGFGTMPGCATSSSFSFI